MQRTALRAAADADRWADRHPWKVHLMNKRERITQMAKEILASESAGIRYSHLISRLQEAFPDEVPDSGNLRGAIWNLDARFPDEVYKPARGLFRLVRFKELAPLVPRVPLLSIDLPAPGTAPLRESDFYEPFAAYLMDELEECTKAVPLGGSRFGGKWGTPDVFGIFRSRDSDIVKVPIEVTSAEIKINTAELITAYGQACAYKLFSHRSYLVVPAGSAPEDIERLDSLCSISGIGLILFDTASPNAANFQIRVRASRHEPDAFYVNQNIKQVADMLGL